MLPIPPNAPSVTVDFFEDRLHPLIHLAKFMPYKLVVLPHCVVVHVTSSMPRGCALATWKMDKVAENMGAAQ